MTYGTGTESNGSEKDVEATRRLMDQIRAGSKTQKGSSVFDLNENLQKPTSGKPPPNDGGGSGSNGSFGYGGQRSFFILLVVVILFLIGTIFSIKNSDNKAAEVKSADVKQFVSEAKVASSQKDIEIAKEALALAEIKEKIEAVKLRETNLKVLNNSVRQNEIKVANTCVPISDVSAGKGYLIARGECLSLPLAPYFIYTASESPVVSVTGADFIITTNDESASCDSTQTNDRCGVWLTQHQTLGNEDSEIFHRRRYWMSFKTAGNVSIYTERW